MTRLRAWLRNQRGFTLAELLLVVAVLGIVMAGVFAIQQQGQQAYLLGSDRVETQQNARIALDLLTRELRSAQSIDSVGSSHDIAFKVCDVDPLDPPAAPFTIPAPCAAPHFQPHTIAYGLSGTAPDMTLTRKVDNGQPTPLVRGVQSLTMTYYRVYDVYNNTYTTTTAATEVKVIKISVTVGTEGATGMPEDQRATMESTVKLRLGLS